MNLICKTQNPRSNMCPATESNRWTCKINLHPETPTNLCPATESNRWTYEINLHPETTTRFSKGCLADVQHCKVMPWTCAGGRWCNMVQEESLDVGWYLVGMASSTLGSAGKLGKPSPETGEGMTMFSNDSDAEQRKYSVT